jgi:hypothetical protein
MHSVVAIVAVKNATHVNRCNVGRAISLSRQGSHGKIMDAFTGMLAVRGCGSSETIFPGLWELCCWLEIRMNDPRSTIPSLLSSQAIRLMVNLRVLVLLRAVCGLL